MAGAPSPTRRPLGEVLALRAACAAARPSSRRRSAYASASTASTDCWARSPPSMTHWSTMAS
eukprot:12950044-Alexandrium_andersonii.AAC.1